MNEVCPFRLPSPRRKCPSRRRSKLDPPSVLKFLSRSLEQKRVTISCFTRKKKTPQSGVHEGTALCTYLFLSLSPFFCPHHPIILTHDSVTSHYLLFLRDRLHFCILILRSRSRHRHHRYCYRHRFHHACCHGKSFFTFRHVEETQRRGV